MTATTMHRGGVQHDVGPCTTSGTRMMMLGILFFKGFAKEGLGFWQASSGKRDLSHAGTNNAKVGELSLVVMWTALSFVGS